MVRSGSGVRPCRWCAVGAQPPAGLGEGLRFIAGSVVGQRPRDVYAQPAVVTHGSNQRVDRAGTGLIGFDRGPADAAVIVDGHVHVIPARAFAGPPTATGYPVAGAPEASEFLDIQMQQIAGCVVLVARDRRRRLEGCQSIQSGALKYPRYGGNRYAHRLGCFDRPRPVFDDTTDEMGSTVISQTRILVAVHPGCSSSSWALNTHQLRASGPNEQPSEKSQLVRNRAVRYGQVASFWCCWYALSLA